MKTLRTPSILFLSLLMLAACGAPAEEKDKVLEVKEYTTLMKTGEDLIDPVHGKETGFWYGAVGSEKANGVAYIHAFEDGTSVVTVNLNILPAPEGTSYRAYLVSRDGKKEVDLGALESIVGDARHSAKGETTEDVTKMLHVEVRLVGGGGGVVATGELKVPAPAVTK